MNRLLQPFLLCLLLLSLCWPASASMPSPAECCAMQMAAAAASSEMADCCASPDELAQSGSPCKAGQACQSSAGWPLLILQFPSPCPAEPLYIDQAAVVLSSTDSACIWRPPE